MLRITYDEEKKSLGQLGKFTQPDRSADPNYFIEFLDIVDRIPEVKKVRARSYDQMCIAPGSRVLDVGCGVGTRRQRNSRSRWAKWIGGRNRHQRGHACSEAIARCKHVANVKLSIGDAYTLPHAYRTLNAVRMERVLLYMPERERAIGEMMRVTQPRGPDLCD
jgi:ubiquinone/menaquinone biosynthesis C-methylase UbiE